MQENQLLSTLVCTLFACLGGQNTSAQTTQASISGGVSENQKSPLPGATVLVRNESTGFTTDTVTNAKGEYAFKELSLVRPYTVRVSFIGFREQKRTGYALNQGDAVRINLNRQEDRQTLELVQVVVSGMKNKIDNLGAAMAVSAKSIAALPVNGRNFRSL
ncbi:MAG: carboxypeptidase regulatory-like domain-containing protein, partial [Sphingobacteriales bacterium]